MANYLRSSMQETIMELHEKGWSKTDFTDPSLSLAKQ